MQWHPEADPTSSVIAALVDAAADAPGEREPLTSSKTGRP
jgi:hypothetical protein